jgi:hypothetical protein
MDADEILNQLEELISSANPNQISRLRNISTSNTPAPVDKFAAKRQQAASAAQAGMTATPATATPAAAEPAKGSPEYFAAKRQQAADAAAANMTAKPTPVEPKPQTFGPRGIPGLGENKVYSKFLDKEI